ncbi:uncharacterized protein ARMOST_14645 [Armillaria ostoyae]|uniref:Uncharacterized protein n=1 Tax=Armillaria ostoyae TaxID=47428 RepID=A0A284RR41_ARMOS|nr:uncharacterized protein ARMOST_14645 [Armillaria ostoyae]
MARIIDVDENDLAAALAMVWWHHPSTWLYKMPQRPPLERSLLLMLDTNFRLQTLNTNFWLKTLDTNFRLKQAPTYYHRSQYPEGNIPAETTERNWSLWGEGAMTVYCSTQNPCRVFYLSRL